MQRLWPLTSKLNSSLWQTWRSWMLTEWMSWNQNGRRKPPKFDSSIQCTLCCSDYWLLIVCTAPSLPCRLRCLRLTLIISAKLALVQPWPQEAAAQLPACTRARVFTTAAGINTHSGWVKKNQTKQKQTSLRRETVRFTSFTFCVCLPPVFVC